MEKLLTRSTDMESKTIPTGAIKTFGADGIAYVVGEKSKDLPDGDSMVNIEILRTGELTEYKLSRLLSDPVAV